jgi:ribosomal protein S7
MFKTSITLNLYKKLLGSIIKKGNKTKAKKIMNKVFFILSKKTNQSIAFLLKKLFSLLKIYMEARTLRIRRRTYIVPFILTYERQAHFVVKFLIKAIQKNKTKQSIFLKFYSEIKSILLKSSSEAYQLKNLNNKSLLENRSNAHFRW